MFLNTNYLQTSFFSCMSVLFFNSPLPQIDKSSGFVTINNKQISWPTSLVIQIPTCFCVTTKAVLLRVFLLRCAEEVLIATDGVQILRICKQYWFRHHWHPCKPMYAGLYQIDITLSSLDKISNDTTTDIRDLNAKMIIEKTEQTEHCCRNSFLLPLPCTSQGVKQLTRKKTPKNGDR